MSIRSCDLVTDQERPPAPVRAALDLGSGEFKLFIGARVSGKIETVAKKGIPVALSADLKRSGATQELSPEIEAQALIALLDLKEEAKKFGDVKIQGAATEVFRRAKNGREVLDRLSRASGIPLTLLTEQEEGHVGFDSIFAFYSEYRRDNTVVFESGSGSVQITFESEGDLESISLPLGVIPALEIFHREVRGNSGAKTNPVSIDEVHALSIAIERQIEAARQTQPVFFQTLSRTLPHATVLGIGFGSVVGNAIETWPHHHKVFDHPTDTMSKEDLHTFIAGLTDREDEDPRIASLQGINRERVIPSTTMLYAFMNSLDFHEIQWKAMPGGVGAFNYLHPETPSF